jgi:hypothetical protein
MNHDLLKRMSVYFNPVQQSKEPHRNGSDPAVCAPLVAKIIQLGQQYNIKSMFDAGCNDCSWVMPLMSSFDYRGGDISAALMADTWSSRPNLNVVLHDATTDPFPPVDMLFIKEVTIHLNNEDKRKVIKNWLSSGIPWLLITHDDAYVVNQDFDYNQVDFPEASVDWTQAPWNFPPPREMLYMFGGPGRGMALWHRDQLAGLV